MNRRRIVLWTCHVLTALALWALIFVAVAKIAKAHDWYSKTGCCGGDDCRPYPCDKLAEDNRGNIVDLEAGTVYTRDKIKPSPNNECHICTDKGLPAGKPFCVFILQGS